MTSIVATGDGSHTLYNEGVGEHYHSINGAIQESTHIFIVEGLKRIDFGEINPMNILEVGYGTGLNAFLTCIEAQRMKRRIQYFAFEPFPVDRMVLEKLNYSSLVGDGIYDEYFDKLVDYKIDTVNSIHEYFELTLVVSTIQQAKMPDNFYHLVYFDAFSPDVQPEMWSSEIFESIYRSLVPGGLLLTYCAKGQVRRNLKAVGFEVERLPGPPGKREITRAIKY